MGYHEDTTHLTKTQLATFIKSPIDYYETFVTRKMKKKATAQMMLGSVCHAVLLEQRKLSDCFLVYPENCLKSDGSINGKPARAFREENPQAVGFGKDFELYEIKAVLKSVLNHQLGELIEHASEREQEVHGEYNGRKTKCKPDFYAPGIIYDLKFMEDVSDPQIKRSFRNFMYWLQDAHYSAVVGGEVGFRFWLVETKYPYRIKSVVYEQRSREIARDQWARSMDRFIEAEASNDWNEETNIELTLNPWDMPDQEEELELEGFENE